MRSLPLVVVCACGSHQPPPQPPPTEVQLVTLAPTEVVEASEYIATLRSRTAAAIQPQVAGQVTKILVEPGATVEPGQPLVQIDPGRQSAAVAQARASQAAGRSALALAEKNLARVEKLLAAGAVPQQELDNARTTVESARAQVEAQGAQIQGSQVELRYYRVLAPSRGTVGDIPARVGDTVTPQTQLTTVTDNSVLEANVSVPVERARQITPATRIDLVDEAGTLGTGTVKFVSPQVSPETQSVLIKADIPNPKGALRSDQLVRARVVWKVSSGLRVPALAVTRVGGQSFVLVAEQRGAQTVARQRPVKLGELIENTYVVLDGLRPGDRIAVSSLQKLRDGAPIQPKADPR